MYTRPRCTLSNLLQYDLTFRLLPTYKVTSTAIRYYVQLQEHVSHADTRSYADLDRL